MTDADIGFIGAVLGTALGIFGAFIGVFFSSNKIIKNIMQSSNTSNADKLLKINEYTRTVFFGGIIITLFLALLATLMYFVRAENNLVLYVSTLLVLLFSFQALLFYTFRKYRKQM